MDDPLVPKSVSGGTRLLVQITCALAVIFIFVAVLLIFIEGGKTGSGGWIVVGTGFLLTTSTTGVLVRWVMKNELEESKHFYLLVAQSLALVVLSAGFLAVIYATETPYFYIGGAAGPVIMETGQRGGPLQIILDNNQSNVITVGQTPCQSFLFPNKIAKDQKYSVSLKSQPSGSLCTLMGGTGTGSKNLLGNDAIRITCQTAWLIGGQISFGGTTWVPGLVLQNNQAEQLPIISATQPFWFPTPVLNGQQYNVGVLTQPPGSNCVASANFGPATAPISSVVITCTPVPTAAPPTKGV
jgi:hypothetical protein